MVPGLVTIPPELQGLITGYVGLSLVWNMISSELATLTHVCLLAMHFRSELPVSDMQDLECRCSG